MTNRAEKIRTIYAIILSVFIGAVGIALVCVAADIYYSGEGPGLIYSREIVGDRLKKLAIPLICLLAAIIAAQMGLTGLIGFRTAELMGKTAVTALCLYAVIRVCQAFRVKRKAGKAQG